MRYLMTVLQVSMLFVSAASADVVRGPNGALLCETANELRMALTIIRNKVQPDHNLRCWNVAAGSPLIRVGTVGPYILVRQPHGSQGYTSPAWLRP